MKQLGFILAFIALVLVAACGFTSCKPATATDDVNVETEVVDPAADVTTEEVVDSL